MKTELPPKRRVRDKSRKREIMFHGIPASPGIVYGTLLLLEDRSVELLSAADVKSIGISKVESEIERFQKAVECTREEIQRLRDRLQEHLDQHEANVFDAHFLILSDKVLMNGVRDCIEKKLLPAEYAFSQIIQQYIDSISAIRDPYLKERAGDIKDVASRVLSHLQGFSKKELNELPGQRIIVSHDLSPSLTVSLDREHLQGFALEAGSKTSHTAILARSMKMPAVVGLNHFTEWVENGDKLILDGFLGLAILNPESSTLALYEQKERNQEKMYAELRRESQLNPETVDGYRIHLAANVESTEDAGDLKRYGAAGIGLFRTEYLYMNKQQLPTEEEQFAVYRQIAEAAAGNPVVIRTFDLGGDKLASNVEVTREQNPFLGLRAIRLSLSKPDMFKTQLRAILRAGVFGNIRMMFPMISSENELDQVLAFVEEVKAELTAENQHFNGHMETGIMIEIPSAALIAAALAKKVDFFSIGTNDLVQYTLAVDRINEKVAHLYEPTHPAVLQLIRMTTHAARQNGIWTGVCGEMGGDLRCIPILIGLGVEELSMSPIMIGYARRLIRKLSMCDAEKIAAKALAAGTAEEALAYSTEYLEKNMPEILALVREG